MKRRLHIIWRGKTLPNDVQAWVTRKVAALRPEPTKLPIDHDVYVTAKFSSPWKTYEMWDITVRDWSTDGLTGPVLQEWSRVTSAVAQEDEKHVVEGLKGSAHDHSHLLQP